MALCRHLKQGPKASLKPAARLGNQAVALGFETLDVAGIHERALLAALSPVASPRATQATIERARNFFAETVVPIERTHLAAMNDDARLSRLNRALRRLTAESSASTRRLKRTVAQRQGAEAALKKSGRQQTQLLAGAHRMQRQLRHLTQATLSAQEHDRRDLSRRLQDDIAQTLLGIHVRLLTLHKTAKSDTAVLEKEIANTQRLVETSSNRIKRFAHEISDRHRT